MHSFKNIHVQQTGLVVKPRTLGREVPGSIPIILSKLSCRLELEQVTFRNTFSYIPLLKRSKNPEICCQCANSIPHC